MKAIINLTTIVDLPCTISHETPYEVNFNITREYATAGIMNNLRNLDGVMIYIYSTYVSVYVKKSFVKSIIFVD